jgi:hypothetical protein
MPRTTRANKAKGRKFQQWVAKEFSEIYDTDFGSQLMGQAGTDVIDHGEVLEWQYTETKHWQDWPPLNHLTKLLPTKAGGDAVFIIKKNREAPLVIVPWDVFKRILRSTK